MFKVEYILYHDYLLTTYRVSTETGKPGNPGKRRIGKELSSDMSITKNDSEVIRYQS